MICRELTRVPPWQAGAGAPGSVPPEQECR